MDYSYIDRNVEAVRRRIDAAAAAVGRRGEDITLLAAVKYCEAGELEHLYDCGIRVVGENRVQQLTDHTALEGFGRYRVHFIGTLQTNKVKYIAGKVDMVESLDSLKLAAELERQSVKAGTVTEVMCEINSGREPNKTGVMPEDAEKFCDALGGFPHLRLCGFMTMAPVCEEKHEYRKFFAETYRLALDIWRKKPHNIKERPLMSMGMSGSFEQAVLEGADIVRIGRGLFEKN